jgi:hypothetical protein
MKLSHKLQQMAVFIEFLAGAGLAIFFHLVLHNEMASYMIFGVGVLLSLATYLLREDMEKTRTELTDLYHQAHEVTYAISRVTDAECQAKAQELLANTLRTITMLQNGFIPLDETEFYLDGAKCSDAAALRIRAVDPVTFGWLARATLVNFYQSNLRALERKVNITRIFVMHREEFVEPEFQKVMMTQLRDGVDIRVAFRDEFPGANAVSDRDTNIPWDFAVYDEQVATEVFPHAGKYYGRKTSQSVEVEKYLHYYQLVEHNAHTVMIEGDQVTLASDVIATTQQK